MVFKVETSLLLKSFSTLAVHFCSANAAHVDLRARRRNKRRYCKQRVLARRRAPLRGCLSFQRPDLSPAAKVREDHLSEQSFILIFSPYVRNQHAKFYALPACRRKL